MTEPRACSPPAHLATRLPAPLRPAAVHVRRRSGPVTPEFLQDCVRSQVRATCNQLGMRSKTIAKTLYSREQRDQPAPMPAALGVVEASTSKVPPTSSRRDAAAARMGLLAPSQSVLP